MGPRVIAALIVVALVPYLASVGFGYVLDDTTVIRSNPALAGWGSLARVWTVPYGGLETHYTGVYRPLTMTLFALVWNLGSHWALWFHGVAIALHVVATLMVLRLIAPGVGRTPALVGALWFAAHPVHAEAVANVANSSEVLVAIWTCALALHLARLSDAAVIGWSQAAAAGLLYLAAFLSKESGAVAPLLAALWIWGWHPPRDGASDTGTTHSRETLSRWWRVGLAVVAAAILVLVLRSIVLGSAVSKVSIAAAGLEGSAPHRIWRMLSLGPRIGELLVWPRVTNPHYGPTTFPEETSRAALATLIVVAGLLLAAWSRARRGDFRWLAALLWVLVAFLPASNILVASGQILAERTLYVSSIGVAMLLALGLDAIELSSRSLATRRQWFVAFGVGIAIVGFFVGRATLWTFVWRTNHSVFAQMIAADPQGYRGYWLAGLEARYAGRRDEAVALMSRAYSLYPRDRGLLMDYSLALEERGDHARATAILAELRRLDGALGTRTP